MMSPGVSAPSRAPAAVISSPSPRRTLTLPERARTRPASARRRPPSSRLCSRRRRSMSTGRRGAGCEAIDSAAYVSDSLAMSARVDADLLLVGSLPADSTEEAFRKGAEYFSDLVFALPDGETGPRQAWVGYERERLARPNPDVVVVEETASPTGVPRHAYETPIFAVREGVDALHWETWPRIDDAIASYAEFVALREAGAVPDGLRFQIGLPFPASALNAFKADFGRDYPRA